ncbi:PLP-dependent aminotransferase family protein [Loktanella sp. SALINAS62]|uniref:MocR-like pyridoxine biosynthesis transcription factor PdxR n=1 Tax=Loktanella sp. SALINAS62 TaxID=2706124 RepID=UPI001B8ABA48|nr:PLP-dependent aminotransferase family protein [Loktanella sp. SALINAS62]MBS1304316.1 PLP-dependent aminotransferase family protein [Loktanella sp. SALINAS62]
MSVPLDLFRLDPATEGTLQQRIRQMVAQGILAGRFRSGERLPSSRKLAVHLGVSRITVTLAYTDLVADDYVTSAGRSGYFVSDSAPQPPDFLPGPATASTVDWDSVLHTRPAGFGVTKPADWARFRYPFIYGQPDPALFDTAGWRLCALQALGKRDFNALAADQYDGDDPKLIDFLTRQILPRRGITATPDEVLITLGAQNALWLSAQVLLTPDSHAVTEDPCYPALRRIVQATGARLSPVPVDPDGLPPDLIPKGANVVFTTPSHQCPTTTTMPAARRRALLAQAERDGFIVVEDDYEFEMAFLGPPQPALKSHDIDGRVIYVGSFSKSLFPGLRLGYLVGPPPFIAATRALRAQVLRHPPGQIQRTAAYFMSLGHYDARVRRMKDAYHSRRRVLDQALSDHGLSIAGSGVYGGSSVWVRAPDGTDTTQLARTLRDRDVLIEPGAPFFAGAAPTNFIRLAYSSIEAPRIAEGIARIAAALATR